MLISSIVSLYDYALLPVMPFSYFNLEISTLDVVAAFRLCMSLRQLRESHHRAHVSKHGRDEVEERSWVRNLAATLIVVYGGDTLVYPLLGTTPPFMVSGTYVLFFSSVQAIVDRLPYVPIPSPETEIPLAILDGITRSNLLCSAIAPVVLTHSSPVIKSSPWTLLLVSLVGANVGFLATNLFSFYHPTPLKVTTPPEFMPYGWTAVDIWCAPAITAIYALLTEAQPFWAGLHEVLSSGDTSCVGYGLSTCALKAGGTPRSVGPLDTNSARAVCAVLLCALFLSRAAHTYGGVKLWRTWSGDRAVKDKSE